MDDLVAGRYQLVRMLGRGGMGEVMLARQLNLDRLVVVKRVADVRSKRSQRALIDEARIAARLNHPNIVSVLDVIEPSDAADQPAVVMEFVAGVSLRELVEDSPDGLPLEIVLPIAIDLLRGLGYAHALRSGDAIGVIHRDVKPRNVMVTFTGVTKLIDFGISRWLSDEGAWDASSVSGTRGYMAPEQQRGERLDGRADIYAAGVTVREMLTGVPPVDDTGHTAAIRTPRTVSDPAMAAIIECACADRADDRYADCDAMIVALEEAAGARGIRLSMTGVRRWTSTRFADRKAKLEQADRTPPHRPPTSPTMFEGVPHGTNTLAIGPRVAFVARNGGAPADDWLAAVVERQIHRYFQIAEDRRFHVVASPSAQQIALVFRREAQRFEIDALLGGNVVASIAAASLIDAVEAIARAATELASEHSVQTSPEDETEMKRFGARSFRAFQRYRAATDAYFHSGYVDSRAIAATLEDVVDEDPEWPRLYAMLVMLYGIYTPDASATIAAARARCPRERDPTGMRMLEAFELLRQHRSPLETWMEIFRSEASDPIAIYNLLGECAIEQNLDDVSAIARRCHETHPDLWFATDLAEAYYRSGRELEGERVIRDAIAIRPENIHTSVALVRLEATSARTIEAERATSNILTIHGERSSSLPEIFEAFVACEQLAPAQRLAETMLLGSPLERARGRYRMAVITVMDGKLGAALNILRRAIDEHRPFAWESELTQCLELARAVADAIGDGDSSRRYTRELVDAFRDPTCTAIARFELELLDGDARIEDHLSDLTGGARDQARTRMLRLAATAGRVPDRDVVHAGFTSNEDSPRSLVAFGLCARRTGDLDIACRGLRLATRLWSSVLTSQSSAYHSILARFHLAGVLAELGDTAGARAQYEAFLRRWGAADRPIAEVAAARQALATMKDQ